MQSTVWGGAIVESLFRRSHPSPHPPQHASRRLKQARVRRSPGATGLASELNLQNVLQLDLGRGWKNAPPCPERPPPLVMSGLFHSTAYSAKGVCARPSLVLVENSITLKPTSSSDGTSSDLLSGGKNTPEKIPSTFIPCEEGRWAKRV